MNICNKLTVLRMILVPFFLATLIINFPYHYIVSLFIFIVASITDTLDGNIARKRGLITDFGKFLDPIADKMLTTAAFLGFMIIPVGYGTIWVTLIIILREFLVASVRMVCAGKGNVIAADGWGKAKTIFQMISIILIIALLALNQFLVQYQVIDLTATINIVSTVLLWICAVLTVVSGVNYLVKNRSAFGKEI